MKIYLNALKIKTNVKENKKKEVDTNEIYEKDSEEEETLDQEGKTERERKALNILKHGTKPKQIL